LEKGVPTLCKCEMQKVLFAQYPFLLGNDTKSLDFKYMHTEAKNVRKLYKQLPNLCIKSKEDYPAILYYLSFLLDVFNVEAYEFFTVHLLLEKQTSQTGEAFFSRFKNKVACIVMSDSYWSEKQIELVLQFIDFMVLTGGKVIFMLFGHASEDCPGRLSDFFSRFRYENVTFVSNRSVTDKIKSTRPLQSKLYTT